MARFAPGAAAHPTRGDLSIEAKYLGSTTVLVVVAA